MGTFRILKLIRQLASVGLIHFRAHGEVRAAQRSHEEDVAWALQYATRCEAQLNGRYRVWGPNIEGTEIIPVVVVLVGDLIEVQTTLLGD